jgi:predicted permease
MNDLKFALRQLLKNPGFTAVAVLSLALGIGACTALFSVVNGVLLRLLPLPNPQELRVLQWTGTDERIHSISGHVVSNGGRSTGDSVSPPMFFALREKAAELADVFAFAPFNDVVARARHEAFAANGMVVSDNFFYTLRVRPFMGRLFVAGNNGPDVAQQVVITHDWWEQRFDCNPAVVGQTVSLNANSCTVIGVLPKGFTGVSPSDPRGFYALLTPGTPFQERAVSSSEHWWIRMMARLHPDATDARLKAVLDVVFPQEAASQMKNPEMLVQPGGGGLAFERDAYRKPLLLMLGAVGLVMLVACANLAGLSLARGAARQHELSVRAALGAKRWVLIRQSMVESSVLVVVGGGFGIILALWGRTVISRLLAGSVVGLHYDLSLDARVLAFTLMAALITTLLSGLLPAWRAGQADPLAGLKANTSKSAPRLRTGRILVVAQIGLSIVLLAGAGLCLRTFANLRQSDAGFDTERLLVFQVSPGFAGYKETELSTFYDRVQRGVAAIPGARSACVLFLPLLDNKSSSGGFGFPGRATPPVQNPMTYRMVVGETLLETLGIPLLNGRNLSVADTQGSPKVIVVNETFARKYFPGEDPIGQTITTWKSDWRIVGVCRDFKYQNIRADVPPTIYISFRQFPLRFGACFYVRTALPPLELASSVRKVVAAIDPAVPVAQLTTQDRLIGGTISQERMSAAFCAALAGFAVLLACIGLYGLMSFNVARRTSEIAIRMAIGAQASDVARTVVREALTLAGLGIALGLPAAFAITRLIRGQLYGVQPDDPGTFVLVAGTLVVVAFVAAWLPARRAARVHPAEALRSE